MSELVFTDRSLKELEAELATLDAGTSPERRRELLDQIEWKRQVQKRKERWSMRRPYEYVTNLKPLDRIVQEFSGMQKESIWDVGPAV